MLWMRNVAWLPAGPCVTRTSQSRRPVQIARETGGNDHHFQVIQLPLNLAMTEAVRAPTQTVKGERMPLLQAAAALGVSVVASASLMQAQLTRGLPAELGGAFPSLTTDAQRALAFTMTLPLCAALVGMRTLDHLSKTWEPQEKSSYRELVFFSAVVVDSPRFDARSYRQRRRISRRM
jgi:hypothetical protein